jgi:molybdopterin converting factor small subunit
MKITLKLFATLEQYLPPGGTHNVAEVEVEQGASIGQVVDSFGIPREQLHMVLVDGHHVPLEEIDRRQLKPGEALAIWPPVAGG